MRLDIEYLEHPLCCDNPSLDVGIFLGELLDGLIGKMKKTAKDEKLRNGHAENVKAKDHHNG